MTARFWEGGTEAGLGEAAPREENINTSMWLRGDASAAASRRPLAHACNSNRRPQITSVRAGGSRLVRRRWRCLFPCAF
jgi:hypothetical protein